MERAHSNFFSLPDLHSSFLDTPRRVPGVHLLHLRAEDPRAPDGAHQHAENQQCQVTGL